MGTPAGIAKNKHSASCYWNAFDDYYRPLDCSKPGAVCCHGHESWCDAVVGSHKDVIDRKTSDGINAQLRDIQSFLFAIAHALPDASAHGPTGPRKWVDFVGQLRDAVDVSNW